MNYLFARWSRRRPRTRRGWAWGVALTLAVGIGRGAEMPDLVIADFEGAAYGDWTVTGEAFGPGPTKGTLPGQMKVDGYLGKRLVNSYHGGDAATGTLTSPPFRIERPYINLLVGGGGHPGTVVELRLDGATVRSVRGPNTQPGGSERLQWKTWEVGSLQGRMARIHIVDQEQDGWGHINVDQIVQSTQRLEAAPLRKAFQISKRYLWVPVKNGAPKHRMQLLVGDRTVREFSLEFATGEPDWEAFVDVSEFAGQTLTAQITLPGGASALDSVVQSDTVPGAALLYRESLRPQFHFTSRRGWNNDPNGMVYFRGEYHLYYQHNPFGIPWGNMHWGHAVSPDMVHWRELSDAIHPPRFGDWVFSGSAAIDWQNTSGFGREGEPPLIAAWTSTGRGEVIAYSLDRGRTFTEYAGNPVVKHRGRDPMIFWHAPTKRWVMALYDEHEGGRYIAFYTSPDLKAWTLRSRIPGYYECPNMFELPVAGRPGESRWIVYAADGHYAIGRFDGEQFTTESGKHVLWHGNFYASQTFSDEPDGRRIQIGWGRGITFPGMPFNQQMTVPVELSLRETPVGLRMFGQPVKELSALEQSPRRWSEIDLRDTAKSLDGVWVDATRIRATVEAGDAEVVGFRIRGQEVVWAPKAREIRCGGLRAKLEYAGSAIGLDILVDRGSIEVFVNEGQAALSKGVHFPLEARAVEAFSRGGAGVLRDVLVEDMASIWPEPWPPLMRR